jgi:hypothetical protein
VAAIDRFQIDIQEAVGLTALDFCNLFNQLSFTNRDITTTAGGLAVGGAAAAGSMVLSQLGTLAISALDNAATDTGGAINKKFVIRRMDYLGRDINKVAGLRQARDGLLKTDPNAEARLLATRDQVESICSNFYESYPSAREVAWLLDDYIEAVASRNLTVEEYNQLLADACYLGAERDKAKAQRNEVAASLQASAHPGLPAMVKFGRALRRHAWERCVEQLYIASRVYTLRSLNLYDAFGDALARLAGAEDGELDSTALDTGLIDFIGQTLSAKQKPRTTRERFVPDGRHCSLTLTPDRYALLFRMLRGGKPGQFRLLLAKPDTQIEDNPFAGMADVRLTHIRCFAKGMKTSDDVHTIEISHPGIEAFVTEDGRQLQFRHSDVQHAFRYNAKTGRSTGNGALDEDHTSIGPFCEWTLAIPAKANAGLDLSGLESITVEFEGTWRKFVS